MADFGMDRDEIHGRKSSKLRIGKHVIWIFSCTVNIGFLKIQNLRTNFN
jgi:hypothetical protein